jgi:hypothetical protein
MLLHVVAPPVDVEEPANPHRAFGNLSLYIVENPPTLFFGNLSDAKFRQELPTINFERFQFEPPGIENLPAAGRIKRGPIKHYGRAAIRSSAHVFQRGNEIVEKGVVVIKTIRHRITQIRTLS